MFKPRTHTYSLHVSGLFLRPEIGFISSRIYGLLSLIEVSDTAVLGMVLGRTGGSSLSCLIAYPNTFLVMPRTRSICGGRNHSTSHARGGRTTSAYIVTHGSRCPLSTQITVLEKSLESLRRELLSEVKEKNIAYSFILGSGSLESFRDFHRNYRERDPHKDCVRELLSVIPKAKKANRKSEKQNVKPEKQDINSEKQNRNSKKQMQNLKKQKKAKKAIAF